jgi:ABC-type polysaccharide/polyol phosphate export permease
MFSSSTNSKALRAEILSGIARWEFWLTMAWVDIRGRYRRTLLGPFWSVLNSVFFICILATVYSVLWKTELTTFLPFVAAGYFVWNFFSISITECSGTFHANAETLKTMPLPPMALLVRVIVRNLMVFAHNLVVFFIIALLLGQPLHLIPLAVPGLLMVAVTALGIGTALAFLCSRYRDFEQITQSVLQVLFFVSPILWQEKQLPPSAKWLADANPIYYLLKIARDPLLGTVPPLYVYVGALLAMLAAVALGVSIYVRFRGRLAYWL